VGPRSQFGYRTKTAPRGERLSCWTAPTRRSPPSPANGPRQGRHRWRARRRIHRRRTACSPNRHRWSFAYPTCPVDPARRAEAFRARGLPQARLLSLPDQNRAAQALSNLVAAVGKHSLDHLVSLARYAIFGPRVGCNHEGCLVGSKGSGRGRSKSSVEVDSITGARSRKFGMLVSPDSVWTFETKIEENIFRQLSADNDRAVAIVAGSMIDIRLEQAIRHRLRRNSDIENVVFRESGPVGTFAAKIDLAFLLGIISEAARQDAYTILGIRNLFAHSLAIEDFSSASIKDRVKQFKLIETHVGNRTHPAKKGEAIANFEAGAIPKITVVDFLKKKNDPRHRYLITCSIFIVALCACEVSTQVELL